MNIIFRKLTASNFMSFKDMSIDLDRFCGQNVLIYGVNDDIRGDSTRSNGSGKSTIMNALLFAVYGDILNPVKMSHVRNWKCSAKDEVCVTLDMESNGISYNIRRILRGRKCDQELRVFRKTAGSDEYEEVTLSTVAETQRMIESDIVLCGKDGFLRCVLLTADQNYNFFKLSKAAKNQFFESLFELTVYSDMYTRLHRRTLDESAALTASSRTIDSLNENIVRLEEKRELERKSRAEIIAVEKEVDEAKRRLEDYERERDVDEAVRVADGEIAEMRDGSKKRLRKRMEEYDAANHIPTVGSDGRIPTDDDELSLAVEKALSAFDAEHGITTDGEGRIVFAESPEYAELVKRGAELKARIEKGETMVRDIEREIAEEESRCRKCRDDNNGRESMIRNMRLTLKTHSKITDLLCEECLGKYKKSVSIEDFDDRIAKLEDEIAANAEAVARSESVLKEKRPTLSKYKSGIEALTKSLLEMRQKAAEVMAERRGLEKERIMCARAADSEVRAAWRERQSKRDAFASSAALDEERNVHRFVEERESAKRSLLEGREALRKSVRDAEYRLKVLSENSDRNFDAPIKTLKESLENAKLEFSLQTANLAHYKALEEILRPDSIRKSVVADMLKELNFRISGYLSKMGSNYTCSFDDDFDATFVSSAGVETEYNNFSSGEKMRLGIACCLAFRDFMRVRLDLHPNILAIDEYIDSNLDPMAVNGIMEMIRYMVGTEKIAAFIISHRSEVMQGMFDSEIMVRKCDNESSLMISGAAGKI